MDALALARQILPRLDPDRRALVALVGAPASGKSTLADSLAHALGPMAEVMPMDGYHLDNAVLDRHGTRNRKGAPWTFDVGAMARDLARLRADDGPVLVPVFDRDLDLSRASARQIDPSVRIVVVEGNYLLLRSAPWLDLAAFWDVSVYLDVPEPVLRERLVARWRHHGWTDSRALDWIERNDLPNARIVAMDSGPADIRVDGQENR